MKEKDIKLLWGRAASRCGICRSELSQDGKAGPSFILGEHAHIVGESDQGPRGTSPLTSEERDSYHNRILLCPTHHTEIDKNEADWPVESLHLIKSTHELWVKENLSETADVQRLADQLAVASLVDRIVTDSKMAKWNTWTGMAYGIGGTLPIEIAEMYSLRIKVASAIIPNDYVELGRASSTLAILLLRFHDTFMEHVVVRGDVHQTEKFYKGQMGWNPNYTSDLEAYNEWVETYSNLLVEATKAANWFAEIVRRDINPSFFVEHGKFVVNMGLGEDLNYHTVIPEYSEEERTDLPASLE